MGVDVHVCAVYSYLSNKVVCYVRACVCIACTIFIHILNLMLQNKI